MSGVKPWQVVVMIVAVVAAAGSIIYSCSLMGEPVTQARKAHMVDIRSGELFEAPYPDKRPVAFPAKNPKTGDATLFPVAMVDNKWLLDKRYLSEIRKDEKFKSDLIVDGKTGEIKAGGKPTYAEVFGK